MASAKVALAADAMSVGDAGAISNEDSSKLDHKLGTVGRSVTERTTAWAVAPRATSSNKPRGRSRSWA